MKKIPTIFVRDPANPKRLTSRPHPACLWVFENEGVATRKYNGTCCMIQDGLLFKRREVRPGKPTLEDFIEVDFDGITGKRFGWVPVDLQARENQWHAEAFSPDLPDGTYELVGPKIQGNPEGFQAHTLIAHADAEILDAPRDFRGLELWLADHYIEGVVWHHPDGRMAKIKKKDFNS